MPYKSRLTTQLLVACFYICLVFSFAAVQVSLAADGTVVAAVIVASLVAVPALLSRQFTPAEIVLVGFSIYSGLGALLAKGVLYQPIEQNLTAPSQTAAALTLAALSVLTGYTLSRLAFAKAADRFALASFFAESAALRAVATPILLAGCGMFLAHILLKPDLRNGEAEGFGGFGSFYFLVNVGLAFVYTLAGRTGRKRHWVTIIVVAAFLLFCSLLSNERRAIIDFCIVSALSFIFNESLRSKWWVLVSGAILGALVLLVISPAIQAVRLQTSNISSWERVGLVWDTMVDAGFNPSVLNDKRDATAQMYQYSFGRNRSYAFPSTSDIDRYSLIFPLDQVVRSQNESLPLRSLFSGMQSMLPGFLVNKTGISSGDEVAWNFGLRAYGSIGRPVLGAPASAFAVGRWWGVAVLPGTLFFLVLSALRVVGGRISESPLAIALATILLVLVEYDVAGLLAYFVRPIWVVLIVLFALRFITKRTSLYRRWGAIRRASENRVDLGSTSPAQTRV